MLSFRRALVAAAVFITLIFFLSRSHVVVEPTNTHPVEKDAVKDSSKPPISTSSMGQVGDNGGGVGVGVVSDQKPMMDMSKLPLGEQLAYQYPYSLSSKFPAYIWQTWRSAPSDSDFEFREQEASWTEQHPGFIHEVITDKVAVSLLRLLYAPMTSVLEAYEALPLAVLKADFFRYLILFARGGIYSDIDTYAIRSAIEWVPDNIPRETIGLVVGIEADPDREDWAEWYSRRIQFCQWTIQAKPGHPVLLDTIVHITEETLKRKKAGQLGKTVDKNVIEFTGPAIWTDVIFHYFNNPKYFDLEEESQARIDWKNFTGMEYPRKVGDVVVLPITGFSPGVRQMGAKEYDDPMAMVKHDFEGKK